MFLRFIRFFCLLLAVLILAGCGATTQTADVAATTGPVAQFAEAIAEGTPVTVAQVIADNVSCLHDYSLSVDQMTSIEQSELVLLSGVGLEDFMSDILDKKPTMDCSQGTELLSMDCHDGHDHGHHDPHIWLSPENAMVIVENICSAFSRQYSEYTEIFKTNLADLQSKLLDLQSFGNAQLAELSCRKLITFHDGFAYLAHAFDLEILEAIEEESGSEASAQELIHITQLVQEHQLPAIFTEKNGSVSAASIICAETGVDSYTLDMAMGGSDYFSAMESNIQTLKEALQ